MDIHEKTSLPSEDAPTPVPPLGLNGEFHPPALDAWKAAVTKELDGADFEKKLFWQTPEGFTVKPLYTRSDLQGLEHLGELPGFAPFGRGTFPLSGVASPWQIRQDCSLMAPEQVNSALLDGLARGQTAIGLTLDDAVRQGIDGDSPEAAKFAGLHGCTLTSINGLRIALSGVDLARWPITISTGTAAMPVLAMLVALADETKVSRRALTGAVEGDPLGDLARFGCLRAPITHLYRELGDMVLWTGKECPGIRPITISTHVYHDSGATAVQELGCALAVAAEYLRGLGEQGITADQSAMGMAMAMSVSTNMFMEIAKLRAARILWAKLMKAFGAQHEDALRLFLHVRTSAHTKTAQDPYNNLIRTTVEAFAGAVGGCNSMYVSPFDEAVGLPEEVSLRLARNQQILLQEESHLSRVVDPSGGSYYVESLTDSIARAAWAFAQEIEAKGGMLAALKSGWVQKALGDTADKKRKAVTGRRQSVVGVSQYPNATERPLSRPAPSRETFLAERRRRVARLRAMRNNRRVGELTYAMTQSAAFGEGNLMALAVEAANEGATIGEMLRAMGKGLADEPPSITPLTQWRLSEPFEALRARAQRHTEIHGRAPRVFLAPLGPVGMRRARTDFCIGFFGAGGFECLDPVGFADVDKAVTGILDSTVAVAVVCSDDASYPTVVPEIVQKVKAKQPGVLIYVAGYPTESVDALKAAGVDGFVHIRADAVETLTALQDRLGVGN